MLCIKKRKYELSVICIKLTLIVPGVKIAEFANSIDLDEVAHDEPNCVDLDEVAHDEPPHPDLHCLPSSLQVEFST